MNAKTNVSPTSYSYTETDPFERATARLDGIKAIQVLADCAMESTEQPTPRVWSSLWFLVATVMEDVERDMHEMRQLQG